jgi:hypothetical protein
MPAISVLTSSGGGGEERKDDSENGRGKRDRKR